METEKASERVLSSATRDVVNRTGRSTPNPRSQLAEDAEFRPARSLGDRDSGGVAEQVSQGYAGSAERGAGRVNREFMTTERSIYDLVGECESRFGVLRVLISENEAERKALHADRETRENDAVRCRRVLTRAVIDYAQRDDVDNEARAHMLTLAALMQRLIW